MLHKFRWMVVVLPALIWILVPAYSYSKGEGIPPGKWWRVPSVAEQLHLSEGEKKELDDLFVQSRRSLIDLKSATEREQFELDNLIDKPILDEAAIMAQLKKVETARSNLGRERFGVLLRVRKMLGFERYQNLKMLFKEFRGKRYRR